jgi:hypothetical protein
MTTTREAERREHHQRMQQLYAVWYETELGGQFSVDISHTLHGHGGARWNRDLFVEDGFPARIMKITVQDGNPVAEWVE